MHATQTGLAKFLRAIKTFEVRASAAHPVTAWIFLRVLGTIYLIAFLSLWWQISGLIGSEGILPATDFLQAVRNQLGTQRYWFVPTLFWLNSSDAVLHIVCAVGVVSATALIGGVLPRLALIFLWGLYLSLTTVGQDFLSFQWDVLLLETGFLAILLAPNGLRHKLSDLSSPPLLAVWLLRWLLFRLMFMSGVVKLTSGDSTWLNLTALSFHYETQPLPTVFGWFAHQLPVGLQQVSVALMFVIEVLVPFLFFGKRRWRGIAFGCLIGLQLLIAATGNYCFFNLLAMLLCLPLVDDRILVRLLPTRWRPAMGEEGSPAPQDTRPSHGFAKVKLWAMLACTALILLVTSLQLFQSIFPRTNLPGPLQPVLTWTSPLRTINSYGLFRVMTTVRNEIVVEGSHDQETWLAYEFKWKPGDPSRAPGWVAPHQPRLDWQMWFAALRDYRQTPWFISFCVQLLNGSEDVLQLLDENPFPDAPPRYVRASFYEYHFTDWETRKSTGAWWRREFKGLYCPVLSLKGR